MKMLFFFAVTTNVVNSKSILKILDRHVKAGPGTDYSDTLALVKGNAFVPNSQKFFRFLIPRVCFFLSQCEPGGICCMLCRMGNDQGNDDITLAGGYSQLQPHAAGCLLEYLSTIRCLVYSAAETWVIHHINQLVSGLRNTSIFFNPRVSLQLVKLLLPLLARFYGTRDC
jgi:hypothetical protein